jgi:DNA-binding transcriptional regulator YiaG
VTGSEVRKIRKRLGLSQADFGKLVGVIYVTVSRWETGATRIPEPTAKLIRLLATSARKGR